MINVLHVINWLRRGGVETQLLQMLQNYDRSGFHMDVCCFGEETGYLSPQAESYGAEVLHCPKSANLYAFSNRFAEMISERAYDIVHSHSEAWSGPVLRGAKSAGATLRIAHIRSSLPQGFRIRNPLMRIGRNGLMAWGRRWLLKYATHILGVSTSALDARFPRWKERENFSVWTLGVDTCKFKKNGDSPRLRQGRNPVIINVGSFIPSRGHDTLIRIFSRLLESLPKARLMLVGEGERLESCRTLAGTLGIQNRVEFKGLRDDIADLLHDADLFVSCSEAEGLPNVLLEAQAAGLPVIASDIAPHRESLPEEAHPFLFGHRDIETVAANIFRILNEPELYESLGRAGQEHVLKYYDAKKNLEQLQGFYQNMCEPVR